jgi:hypothetical protein
LHRGKPGDEKAPQRRSPLGGLLARLALRIERIRVVADRADGFDDLSEADLPLIPRDERATRRAVHMRPRYARELPQAALDQPDAAGARHAFQDQQHLAGVLCDLRHELALRRRLVVGRNRDRALPLRIGRRAPTRRIARLVVGAETLANDRLRNRFASRAAEFASGAEQLRAMPARFRRGAPAVKARRAVGAGRHGSGIL